MNIVFITPSPKTGGGNRVFIELANQLCDAHNIWIVYPQNSESMHTFDVNPSIELTGIGEITGNKMGKLRNIRKTIRYLNDHHQNDTLIISDPIFCLFSGLLKSRRIFRFIQADDYRIFDDGAILGKGLLLSIYKKLCLRSYRNGNIRFIFNSRFVYDRFSNDSKRTDVPYQLVHPALNIGIFRNEKSGNQQPQTDKKPDLCLVARKHPWKGLNTFTDMVNTLSSEARNTIGHIFLISHDDLSGYDTSGMHIIRPRSDREIASVYNKSDIFISTSWWEGFGLPPLEAMSCGCACIISKSGGVDEYAEDGMNCLMFTPKDERELKTQLIRLISDKELRERLQKNGQETAGRFTWEKSARQFINIIDHKSCSES